MNRTEKVRCVIGGKFVKLYDLIYKTKTGEEATWRFASRRNKNNTLAETGIEKPDAVVIVPLYIGEKEDTEYGINDVRHVVTKEYRPPLGDYEYGVPAGIIDKGESVEDAARRELFEETGLTLKSVIHKTPILYSSAGLTDESTSVIFVSCYGIPNNSGNEDNEDIEIILVSVEDMNDFISYGTNIFTDGKFGAKGYMAWMLMSYIASTLLD